MTQTSYLGDQNTQYRFFTNGDAALIDYLQTDAPNGLAAWITANVPTLERNVLEFPAEAQSLFPAVYLWTTAMVDDYHAPPSPMLKATTRFLVWDLDADMDTMYQNVQGVCGVIASAIQQTTDTSGNDWADFYCAWGLQDVTVGPIAFIPTGDNSGLVQGTVVAQWTHDE